MLELFGFCIGNATYEPIATTDVSWPRRAGGNLRTRCHRCQAEMGAMSWKCPDCRVQNRFYTRGQWVVAIILGLFVLFFMGKR